MSVPQQIDVYADVACPFAHVSLRRLSDQRRAEGLHKPLLVVRAWPLELVNDEPHSGEHLSPEIDALRRSVAPDLFAGFDADRFPRTSLPALAATAAAYRAGTEQGEAFALAVRDALWEDGLDIADDAVLDRIADTLGVPRPDDEDHERVRCDHQDGRGRGVEGSPHYFVDQDDYFAPDLDIEGKGKAMTVRFDRERWNGFAAAVLG